MKSAVNALRMKFAQTVKSIVRIAVTIGAIPASLADAVL